MEKRPGHVVIIDDSEMDIFLLSHILKSFEAYERIETFSDSMLAFQYFHQLIKEQAELPELVFMDINMPGLSGFEFLTAFENFPSSQTRNCKFIIVSSSDAEEDISRSAEFPQVIKYLLKPVSKLDFIDLDAGFQKLHNKK